MLHRTLFLVPALAFALLLESHAARVATAQEPRGLEVGMDGFIGGRTYDDGNFPEDVFYADLPVASVRVGRHLSDRVALEPALGFHLINVDSETLSELDFDLGLLLYMAEPGRTAAFFRIGGGILLVNSDQPAATQFSAGLAFGVRIPAGDRFAVRLQAGVDQNFEGDLRGSHDFGAKVGFSFFTR